MVELGITLMDLVFMVLQIFDARHSRVEEIKSQTNLRETHENQ